MSGSINWSRGPLSVGWTTRYQSEQGLAGVEVDTFENLYGSAGYADEVYIHDLTATYDINDSARIYGGINNIEDKEPFITETAWPVSPRGRFAFVGVDISF